jgi:two-component system, response regulator, stage 0 sporulation protein F
METSNRNNAEKQGKILIIDDSPIIRQMLIDVLTDEGYEVEAVVDGQTGVEKALAQDYLVMLCDVHMPVKNGLEAVREIIAAKPHAQIIMTDSLPDKLARSAQQAGAICCLQKPFDVTELRNLIAGIAAKRGAYIG